MSFRRRDTSFSDGGYGPTRDRGLNIQPSRSALATNGAGGRRKANLRYIHEPHLLTGLRVDQ